MKDGVFRWLLLALPLVGCIWAGLIFFGVAPAPHPPETIGELGQSGDFFGGLLNPLISLLTLFVAISVWQLQTKELEETKNAIEEQSKTAELQRQEQRFFDLMDIYQRTVDSISHTSYVGSSTQRELLSKHGKEGISFWLSDTYINELLLSKFDPVRLDDTIQKRWLDRDAAGRFDHYFRVIYRILSEAEPLLGTQHLRYVKLFRAQLTQSELAIIGTNLWIDSEGKKMIPLAEKYGLLKHLPVSHLRHKLSIECPMEIFGKSHSTAVMQDYR